MEVFLDESGILHMIILDGIEVDIDDAADNFLVIKQLSGGQKRLKLLDARANWKITKKAKEYSLKGDTLERTIANAVIVKSFANKFILGFLNKFNKPQTPLKVFLSEKEAIKWLKAFK